MRYFYLIVSGPLGPAAVYHNTAGRNVLHKEELSKLQKKLADSLTNQLEKLRLMGREVPPVSPVPEMFIPNYVLEVDQETYESHMGNKKVDEKEDSSIITT